MRVKKYCSEFTGEEHDRCMLKENGILNENLEKCKP
jgi:hypothetical protein